MSKNAKLSAALAAVLSLALAAILAPLATADVPAAPAWNLQALSAPSDFVPGDTSGVDAYEVFLTNSGAKVSDRTPITLTDTLPPGLGVESVQTRSSRQFNSDVASCKEETVATVTTVSCVLEEGFPGPIEAARLDPSEQIRMTIHVTVPAGETVVPLTNEIEVKGGGAETVSATSHNEINPECKAVRECAPTGFQEFHSALLDRAGRPVTAAASHPYQYLTGFAVNLNPSPPDSELPFLPARGDLKRVEVALPPGLIANPTAAGRCSAEQFNTLHYGRSPAGLDTTQTDCPDSSAVGVALVQQLEGTGKVGGQVAIYNMIPPRGMPAELAFQPIIGLPFYIETALVSGPNGYTVRAFARNIPQAKRVTSTLLTLWGTPADPSHDPLRGQCAQSEGNCPAGIAVKPSFRLPTSCESTLFTTGILETWAQPATGASASVEEPAPVGCNQPPFTPTITAKPTTNVADSPTGLHVDLHLPQKENEDPEGVAEADLKDATVTLPPGLSVNPSSANGLGACALEGPEGINLPGSKEPAASEAAKCPDASKIGTVEVDTPLVDHPLPGSVYLARQGENPFGSLLAIYIAVNDPQSGVVVKLAAKVSADPVTGQLTTTVSESPQTPFEDFHFDFFEGARAPLRTPSTCGESPTTPSFTTTTSLTPWTYPASGPPAAPADSFAIATAPSGGPCAASKAALPNAPSFEAGTQNPLAGAYSPFVLKLSRQDGSQELQGLNVNLPTGLIARLAGTPECPAAGIAQAQARDKPGEGALELQTPSCPTASQLGSVSVGAGAGPSPFYAQGKAYLAGPYKGAPLSMEIITPAVAGPFDLGVVAVRAALYVDPESTQVKVKSDPIPTIVQGIPLDVRSIAVKIDKQNFTLNPTSCETKAITAEAISTQGNVAALNNRFQVGGCQNLAFKPNLSLKLKGGTKRGDHPALTATLTYPKGDYANIAKAQVALPHSEFLDTTHIKTICTRVQFAANSCPAASIYGTAKAITPLLDQPLEGPVYLRSSSHPLPDLVADLGGQINVVLDGRVDSVHGGIRNSFEAVPDAPVSKFTLSLPAGKKGLLQNSTDICAGTHKATATFTAQNGKVYEARPELEAKCGSKARKKHKAKAKPKRGPKH